MSAPPPHRRRLATPICFRVPSVSGGIATATRWAGLAQPPGVLGFTPGYGTVASVFTMALPTRVATAMVAAVTDDDDVPPF
jgi:hypothetical protein